MSKYEEIEVSVLVKDGKKIKYSFSKDVISHYKQYVSSPLEKRGSIITMLWLKGNPNALRLDVGYDTFKKKLGCDVLDISGLSDSQKEELKKLKESF
tara:strand:- start:186 stop:476 length:291 start_codon:yes stop_codon:yes gene_type:complete